MFLGENMDLIERAFVSYIKNIILLMDEEEDKDPKKAIYDAHEFVQYIFLKFANSNIDKITKG